ARARRLPMSADERAMIISSDGHAMPRMRAYRPYLPAHLRARFDEFCEFYDQYGAATMDPVHLLTRLDPDVVEEWSETMARPGRLEGCGDPVRRIEEMDREGIVGEVIFPDFGLPFEAFGPASQQFVKGAAGHEASGDGSTRFSRAPSWPARTTEEIVEGNRAHNRWLVDFCATEPERLCAMAIVSFDDVDDAMAEIAWAREPGL